jgi:5-methylcytosine-specific restriction endonuclease McrA
MKKIDIQGKRNQDKMKQMADPDAVIERKVSKNRGAIPDAYYAPDQALGLAVLKASTMPAPDQALGLAVLKASTMPAPDQSLGLSLLKEHTANMSIGITMPISEPTNATTTTILTHILREIDLKRKAYIYQDKHHEIYDTRFTITTDRIVELLVAAELLCHYCREICQVVYKETMCRRQWTLDRIDNNYGHNDANVVIACLDCNLKRGTMDAERFRQGKQFTFRKVE